MSAVTADRDTKAKAGSYGEHPVAASTTIYAGTLTMRDATGFLKNGADTASHVFAGVAREYANNSAGAAGDVTAKVSKTGEYKFAKSGSITVANIGTAVYLVDNQTVALAATTDQDIACGVIVDVEGDELWIRIDGYAI